MSNHSNIHDGNMYGLGKTHSSKDYNNDSTSSTCNDKVKQVSKGKILLIHIYILI